MNFNDYKLVCTHVAQCNMGSDFWDVRWTTDKRPTVNEFIRHVVHDRSHEWGSVDIILGDDNWNGNELVEFSSGQIIHKHENDVMMKYSGLTVKDAECSGGWSCMHWHVKTV